MILPYFIDMIPEKIGMVISKLIKWQPEEKRVLLAIEESSSPLLNGKIISGKIARVKYNELGEPQDAIIQLDSSLDILNRRIRWVMASPRFKGHGLYRLLVTWSVVHIFPIDGPECANKVLWENMVAISLMKLDKRRENSKRVSHGLSGKQ